MGQMLGSRCVYLVEWTLLDDRKFQGGKEPHFGVLIDVETWFDPELA
jgi:hypothetical protein